MTDDITTALETLAREFHEVYQSEARRQGDVRHADDYNDLPENVKEFDRALARHVLAELTRLREALASSGRYNYDGVVTALRAERDEWKQAAGAEADLANTFKAERDEAVAALWELRVKSQRFLDVVRREPDEKFEGQGFGPPEADLIDVLSRLSTEASLEDDE